MNNSTLVLFKSQSGSLSAKIEYKDGSVIHIHSLVDPESECEYFSDSTIWGDVLILEGSGLGYHLTNMLVGLRPEMTIVLLEYYNQCADICAQRIKELSGITPVVITADSQNNDVFLKDIGLSGKLVQIIKHPASYSANRLFYDKLLGSMYFKKASNFSQKIIALMNGKFFLQREICNAVEKSSDHCVTFNYENLNSIVEYENTIQYCIQNEKPDMFISVNMLGFDGNGIFPEYCHRYGIPVAVWFVDDPRPILLSQKRFITTDMTAFCWERDYLEVLRNAGFSNVHYLPLAADLELFSPKTINTKSKIPLAFAGTSMAGTFRKALRNKFLWKKEIEPLVNKIAQELLESPSIDIPSNISQFLYNSNTTLPFHDERNSVWLQSYIIHTAGMIKRKNTIESLKNQSIELFGDKDGWNELLGEGYTIHPPVDYATQLCDVYHNATINLNITSCQMTTAVNQRVFDVPVSGNFLITDFQKDVEELFDKDEVVTYRSLQELNELCTWYIRNESSQETVTNKARTRILHQHTYTNRYQTIREKML
jgi:spore maturation protein CgeB